MANHTLLLLLRNSGLTFLCVFILFNEAFAQPLDGNDQVDSTDFYRQPWIGNNQYLFDYRDWLEGSKSKTSTIAPYGVDQQVYIPVKAWVYRSNTGLGGLSYADVEW
ncbi:MAG TPA: hypothetical protein DDW81_05160, partial [Cryomorphaceae bacterium]|nr:hypothetical protein [Cryomorphaceae bacterium]